MKTIEDYNTLVKTYIDTKDNAKAPTDHSSTATTYGVGSTTKYGHVKVDDALSSTSTNPVQNKKVYELKQALSNEVTTRATNGAHNLFDFEGMLKAVGTSYTKTNNIYSISNTYGLSSHPYQFSDTDVDIMFSFGMTAGTASNPRFDLLNSNDQVVATVTSSTTGSVSCCKVRFNSSSNGSVTIGEPMIKLATDGNSVYMPFAMTNKELTDNVLITDISSEISLGDDSPITTLTYARVLTVGKLVVASIAFTTSAIDTVNRVFLKGFPAPQLMPNFSLSKVTSNGSENICLFINESGQVKKLSAGNEFTSGTYIGQVIYVAK